MKKPTERIVRRLVFVMVIMTQQSSCILPIRYAHKAPWTITTRCFLNVQYRYSRGVELNESRAQVAFQRWDALNIPKIL